MPVFFRVKFRISFLAMLFLLPLLLGGVAGGQEPTVVKTIQAVGSAEIEQEGVAKAREQAISRGLYSAVEMAAGDFLPSELPASNLGRLNEVLRAHIDEYITDYKVLTETRYEQEYEVFLEATVSILKIKATIAESGVILDKSALPRILLLIAEQDLQDPLPRYWWGQDTAATANIAEGIVADALRSKGYEVVDHPLAAGGLLDPDLNPGPEPDDLAAAKIGRRFKADVVVVGRAIANRAMRAMGSNLDSFKGTVGVRVLRAGNSEQIASTIQSVVKENADEVAGVAEAIAAAGDLAGQVISTKIAIAWHEQGKPAVKLEVVVEGTDDLENFIKFRYFLSAMPGVTRVQPLELKYGEALLGVDYQGDAAELASSLKLQSADVFNLYLDQISPTRLRIALISTH